MKHAIVYYFRPGYKPLQITIPNCDNATDALILARDKETSEHEFMQDHPESYTSVEILIEQEA